MTEPTNPNKPPRVRSPSYPGSTLEVAVQRARILFGISPRYPMPYASILKAWKFVNPNSGNASVAYAAMKKYGLLSDVGKGNDRQGKLTDLALNVISPNPKLRESLQEAALTPTMMREWWSKYGSGDLPTMDTLRFDYVVKGKFTQGALEEFTRIYKANVSFAELDPSVTLSHDEPGEQGEDHSEGGGSNDTPSPPRGLRRRRREMTDSGVDVLTIPLLKGQPPILIEGVNQISEENWAQFMAVLNVMKPSLIHVETEDSEEN